MFFKMNQLKITPSPIKLILLFTFCTCVFLIVQFINSSRFSDSENALYENLIQELVNQEVCTDSSTCAEKIHFYRRSARRIYFNMYSQTDMALVAKVGKFLVKNGIKLSEGKPITLKVYATPKIEKLSSEYFFGYEDPLLTLEIEK